MTAMELTEKVQGGVLKAVETSQGWTLGAMRSTASAFDTMKPDPARIPFADKMPTPAETVDSTFGFWSKLLEAQHTFAAGMVDIYAKPA
jgi:hypothetical protein